MDGLIVETIGWLGSICCCGDFNASVSAVVLLSVRAMSAATKDVAMIGCDDVYGPWRPPWRSFLADEPGCGKCGPRRIICHYPRE